LRSRDANFDHRSAWFGKVTGRVVDNDHTVSSTASLDARRVVVVGVMPKRSAHMVIWDGEMELFVFSRLDRGEYIVGEVIPAIAFPVGRHVEPVCV
jgi:hypothetical protein